MLGWSIVLGVLVVVLLLRDEVKKVPPVEVPPPSHDVNDKYEPDGYAFENHVPITREETDERLKAFGIDPGFKDYSRDDEFCRKHPCDYMKPYVFPDGRQTYCCTNENAWERWGIKELILQGLNEGAREMCARCAGLPCYGERKPS